MHSSNQQNSLRSSSVAWRVSLEQSLRQLPFSLGLIEDPVKFSDDFNRSKFEKNVNSNENRRYFNRKY